uniref:adenylate kinase n=1 Tax=Anthurium amnicola TaxID=1678845 RepID=A0A1D1XFM2_9ARAE
MWRRVVSFSPMVSSPGKAVGSALWQMMQTSYGTQFAEAFANGAGKAAEADDSHGGKKPFITFVLGGPGSGKGTQCVKISEMFGFVHLSAGDLLRKEISSNSDNGVMIRDIIKEGKIVPSEITVNLIRRAIESSEKDKVLIDGFPRCDENRIAFEKIFQKWKQPFCNKGRKGVGCRHLTCSAIGLHVPFFTVFIQLSDKFL